MAFVENTHIEKEMVFKMPSGIEVRTVMMWYNGHLSKTLIDFGGDNNLNVDSKNMHAFYELIEELKVNTNNPPVGCEPV